MNKRILISLLMLLIAAVLSVTSFLILQDCFSGLGEALENAIYTDVPLREASVQIRNAWDRCEGAAQTFLLHSDLTELRTAVESLPDLTAQPAVFRGVCIRSLRLLEGIQDSLALKPDNIL